VEWADRRRSAGSRSREKGTLRVSTDLDILAVSPPGFPSASLAAAAHRAGIQGGVSLEHADSALAGRVLEELAAAGVPFTVFVPRLTSDIENLLKRAVGRGLTRLVLCEPDSACLGREIAFLRGLSLSVLVQAICLEDAKLAEKCGADAIVVKGSDGGGRIGEETTFILLQRIVPKVTLPVWARGGIGLHTAAACLTGGATGIVLDWQLALCEESQLPDDVKARIARMDGSETAVLGQELGRRYRAYARPGESAYAALKALEESLILDDAPSATRDQHWRDAVEAKIVTADAGDRLLLIGQDAVFAAPLAERFRSVKGIAQAMRRAAVSQCQSAARDQALRPGGPMAESHGTRYPIVQGPMTRVSDTADFALAVAEGGGLPFLALALLRGPQVADLLEETKRKLGKLPWGIGILGFVPKELREEQLAEVRKHPSPYAIIAGGRPDQAQALESQGIHTYLHIPSPALLKMFLEGGVRRVIFEGRECGGHVGPRTSFVLWDQMIRVILEHLDAAGSKGEDYHVLFAGGIHDAASASMVAAMAAPLSERGVRIGVLLGTSYLFTKEAVVSGAIVEGFQQEALACQQTILLESGVGHATRCADTPFGRLFAEEKRRLFREGRSKEEIREALEMLNLGRLRIASKGVTRSDPHAAQPQTRKFKQLDDQEQRGEGMYMIGQVAALRNSVCTIEELHDDVSRKGAERLQAYAAPKNDARVKDGSRPSDVAIIGMSCMFPKANDLRRFWENILAKVDAIQEIPADRWNWETYFDRDRTAKDKIYSKWGGFLDDVLFDPTSYGMPPNTLPSVEPLQLLVLEAVRQGLRDAGYENRPFPRERTSVVLGAGGGVADLGLGYGFRALLPYFMSNAGGDWSDAAELIERLEGALPEWTEDSFAGLLMNVAAGRVANRFDLGGSNYTVDAACASSLAAVRLAVNELESGSSDMVIVGGADTMQSPFAYLCFSKTQALSPTGQCRTFDESADGIVISEGIAVAILKRLDDAVRDGDRVYAVIKGVGSSSDGKDRGLTAPRPAGQIRALERAYAKAGYAPTTVGLVEAHGTGTVAGDQSEVESLTRAFTEAGADVQSCALGSVKSMIGHTKCTAGVAGLLKTALALYHRVLPATNGVKKPNPKANFEKSPFYLNSETRPWIARPDGQPRRASVSAFGFGGTNFHAALEEFIPPNGLDDAAPAVQTWPAELFVWRAESASTIVESLDAMTAALDQGAAPQLRDLAFAVWQSYGHRVGKCCLAVVAGTLAELQERMAAARAALHSGVSDVRDSKGVYYSSSPLTSNGKVAFLFPGQGSQSVNMLRDLAIAYPGVREVFEDADRSLGNELGRRLSSFVFPRPTFTPEEAEANDAALTQTNVAQPAMGAADMAMYTVLTDLGLRAECAGGHSYGEYAALCAAGAIHPADLMRISEARGRLVAQAGKESPGTMAAVDADEHTVAAVIGSLTDVWVANLNSPTQTVISGTQVGVEQALGKLSERGLHGRRIRVSCAFHSKLVAAAQTPFRAVLDEISFSSPRVPVFSNTTASPHTADPGAIKNQLVEHLARPVRFADELVAMYDAGSRVFVEVGPGRTLTGLVERTLAGRPFLAVNMDQPGRNGLLHLVHALAQLASAGVNMDLRRLFEGRIERTLDLGRLVEQTKPAPPSATTWKVNGARAVPLKEPTKRTGPLRKPVASPATPVTVTPVATAAPTASAASVLSTPPALRSAPTAIESSPSASVVQRDGIEGVMSAYQTLMAKFLDTQKSVMLSYLQGAPAPTMAQLSHVVAAPAQLQQSVLAPITPSVMTPIVQMETVIEPAAVAMEAVAVPDAPVPMAEQLVARLTKIVSDRTGYPPEMLNLDADLEADLGIDSIKRIEILGTLQNDAMLPAGSADGDMEVLAKLKTLRAIVDWIVAKSGEVKAPPTPSAPVAPQATPEPVSQKPPERIPRMLLQVQDCAVGGAGDAGPLAGVVLITDDEHGVANALAEALRGRGVSSVIVSDAGDGSGNGKHPRIDLADGRAVAEFAERIRKTHGRIGALVHLTPLEENAGARGDGPIQSRGSVHGQLQALFNLIQTLEPDLRKGGSGRILTATRMGGDFGSIGGSGAEPFRPGDGGICGMVKSLAREWTETACKAVDFDSAADNEQIVAALLSELDACDGISEVGHRRGNRIVLRPFDAPLSCASPTIVLDRDSVVLITGGARGITAEVVTNLRSDSTHD
jgi:malonyl CoA-acyl carrier protein transacylase